MGKKIVPPPPESLGATKPVRRRKTTKKAVRSLNRFREQMLSNPVAGAAQPNYNKRDRRTAVHGEGMIGGKTFRRGLKNLQRRQAGFDPGKGFHLPGSRKKH